MHINDSKAMIASRLILCYDLLQYVDMTFWYISLTASDSPFTSKLVANVVAHIRIKGDHYIHRRQSACLYNSLVYVTKL